MSMAYLHKALEKEFGKDYDKESQEVKEFTERFNERSRKLYGNSVSLLCSSVSCIDFYKGMQVKFDGDVAIVDRVNVDLDKFDDSTVTLVKKDGTKVVLTDNDFDCYYYFDDFFTRPNDKLLEDFGYVKIKETKTENDEKTEDIRTIWRYEGSHPITNLPDFWFSYIFSSEIIRNSRLTEKIGVSLPEYKISLYCGEYQLYPLRQMGMEHLEYLFDYNLVNHKPLRLKCKNDDLIITDPCYLFGGHNYNDFMGKIKDKGFNSTTLYGDWSCTVFEDKSNNILGYFCAESGQVCVYKLKDILEANPSYDKDHVIAHGLATEIKNFTGEISLNFIPAKTLEELEYQYGKVIVVGKGNINFHSSQTVQKE